jgi:hypothetical protein
MAEPVLLTFEVYASHNNSGIEITVQLDNSDPQITKASTDPHKFSFAIDDEQEAEHVLKIVMSGKTHEHTELDDQNNIVKDVMVYVSDKSCNIDDINIAAIFSDISTYVHDHNGTTEPITDKFFGPLGCNGTVTLKFRTPVYLWLLEHL